jgi:Pyruvate/2-oxoacid:ferredoxin oxidoreductase gamma subunit
VYVNAAERLAAAVETRLADRGTRLHVLDAAALAEALGAPGVANVILLGFVAAHGGLGLTLGDLNASIEALGPRAAVPLNAQALAIGAAHHATI